MDRLTGKIVCDSQLRLLSEPVALLRALGGEAVMEDFSPAFARALSLDYERDIGIDAAVQFGASAAILFRQGIETAHAGRTHSRRIPLRQNGHTTDRIFLFRAGPFGQDGQCCLVALERRNRSVARPEGAPALAPVNSISFFTHDADSGLTRYSNPSLAGALKLPAGRNMRAIMRRVHKDDLSVFREAVRALPLLSDGQVLALTLRLRDTGKKWRTLSIRTGRESACFTGMIEDETDHLALKRALNSASLAVQEIEARERRRIARELHDSTAQHLVAIDLNLTSLGHTGLSADMEDILRQIRDSLKTAQREIRSFSYLLHPPQVAENGLKSALFSFIEGFGRRTGLTIHLESEGPVNDMPPETERILYRVAQEALMNVHRHADATVVEVGLHCVAETVRLEITDNGRGMPRQATRGVGLAGMIERMEQIGGSLHFGNIPTGFQIVAVCRSRA